VAKIINVQNELSQIYIAITGPPVKKKKKNSSPVANHYTILKSVHLSCIHSCNIRENNCQQ